MGRISRRGVVAALGVLSLAALPSPATFAETYPTRPVKLVSPYAPGGATDIIARLIGQWLSERLGTAFVIENRPGSGANIGTEAVIRSPADGYTLLLTSTANAVNASLYQNLLKFNFIEDTVPIGSIGSVPNVLIVHPSSPAKTTGEFIAYAKANPSKVSVGVAGIGSPQHLSGELFKMMTGVDLVFVQYRGGGPVLNDLLGGHLQASFSSSVAGSEYIKAGTLRGLGVTSATRSEAFPDVPTLGETVKDYESTNFYGVSAPKGTPADIVKKISAELAAGLTDAKVTSQLATLGVVPKVMSPSEFDALIRTETEKWTRVVTTAGLKPQ